MKTSVKLLTGVVFLALPVFGVALHSETSPTRPQHEISVADGNVSKFLEAVEEANDPKYSEYLVKIAVAGNFNFTADHDVPPVMHQVLIEGPARFMGPGVLDSTLSGDEAGPSRLFQIESEAQLDLQDIELTGFSLNHDGPALITNYGSLKLHRVQIQSSYSRGWCIRVCTPQMPVIFNDVAARLFLDQVSFVDSGSTNINTSESLGILKNLGYAHISNSQFYIPGSGNEWANESIVSNWGNLEVVSSTFWLNGDAVIPRAQAIYTSADPVAVTNVYGSIISGFSGDVCRHSTSGGYNLIEMPDCNWASETDLIGVDPQLIWRPVNAQWPEPLLLQFAAVPAPASAAVDSAPPDPGNLVDLLGNRRDTRLNGEFAERKRVSDRGAVELWKTVLSQGGINGLFYNPEADGHYVQILQTDFLTLVIWNTFDLDGNHIWVYGTGQLVDGRSVVADTYINRDVLVNPENPDKNSGAEYWGTIEVEMFSCEQGRIRYESLDPNFGSGEFQITRLAFIKQLGCND